MRRAQTGAVMAGLIGLVGHFGERSVF